MAGDPRRKTTRWTGYDYRTPACYFVTICTASRQPILSDIRHDLTVEPTVVGRTALEVLAMLPDRYLVDVSAQILMPDHLHVVLSIEPQDAMPSLGKVVGAFKSLAWRRIREDTGRAEPIWQRGYHDRVIRSDAELERIHAYIMDNPHRWLARHGGRDATD